MQALSLLSVSTETSFSSWMPATHTEGRRSQTFSGMAHASQRSCLSFAEKHGLLYPRPNPSPDYPRHLVGAASSTSFPGIERQNQLVWRLSCVRNCLCNALASQGDVPSKSMSAASCPCPSPSGKSTTRPWPTGLDQCMSDLLLRITASCTYNQVP